MSLACASAAWQAAAGPCSTSGRAQPWFSAAAGRGARASSWRVAAELGGRAGSSSGGSSGDSEARRVGRHAGGRRRKARAPGLFEVQDVSPPPRSLGIHALPPNTHNGDQIEVAGSAYVVQSVVMQYRLVKGKYRRDHARLEVQGTGRMLANLFLEDLYLREGPPGADGAAGSSGGGGSGQ